MLIEEERREMENWQEGKKKIKIKTNVYIYNKYNKIRNWLNGFTFGIDKR
jgi:hypothetical protein